MAKEQIGTTLDASVFYDMLEDFNRVKFEESLQDNKVDQWEIKNFCHSSNPRFESVTKYSEVEGRQDVFNLANEIFVMQGPLLETINNEDFEQAESMLIDYKKKMDSLLEIAPEMFLSNGLNASKYESYKGCFEYGKKNLEKARKDFLRGLVNECLYLGQCTSKQSYPVIAKWSKTQIQNAINFNMISTHKICDVWDLVTFKNIGSIFLAHLIKNCEDGRFSYEAYDAFLMHVKSLLDVSRNRKEHDFSHQKIINSLYLNKKSLDKVSTEDWTRVEPALKRLQADLHAPSTVDELVDYLWNKLNDIV